MFMKSLKKIESWDKLFCLDDSRKVVVWRPVQFDEKGHEAKLDEVFFEPTARETFIARVNLEKGNRIWEPEINPNKKNNKFIKGLALFIKEVPPTNWTHLLINGVSKVFRAPGRPAAGACIFAEVGMPYDEEDYLQWRKDMSMAFCEEMNSPPQKILAVSEENTINGFRRNEETRLFIKSAWNEQEDFFYSHI